MADTIREQIIQAFTARAQSLSTREVERVRLSLPDEGCRNVSIWDGEDVAEESLYGVQRLSFPIALNIQWEPDGVNPSADANAVIGEAIMAMLGNDSSFGGLADRMDYASATPEYPADGSGLVSLVIIFTVFYTYKHGDPFTAV